MTDDLLRAAVRKYRFRAPHLGETDADYRAALVAFVHARDFAAAHELRIGKPQAQWTSDETRAFRERLQSGPRDTHDPFDHPISFLVVQDKGPYEVSDEGLLAVARRGLDGFRRWREESPTREIQIMASVLLTDGQILHAQPSRADRIRAIKLLSKQYPVYGFFLCADVYVHALQRHPVTGTEVATKTDGFVMHVASRTLRRMLTLRYRIEAERAIFEPLLEFTPDQMTEDPYADVFVSVPPSDARPS